MPKHPYVFSHRAVDISFPEGSLKIFNAITSDYLVIKKSTTPQLRGLSTTVGFPPSLKLSVICESNQMKLHFLEVV